MSTGNRKHTNPNSRKLSKPNHGRVTIFFNAHNTTEHVMLIADKTTGMLALKENSALRLVIPCSGAIPLG
jgi:hypothetical protein